MGKRERAVFCNKNIQKQTKKQRSWDILWSTAKDATPLSAKAHLLPVTGPPRALNLGPAGHFAGHGLVKSEVRIMSSYEGYDKIAIENGHRNSGFSH